MDTNTTIRTELESSQLERVTKSLSIAEEIAYYEERRKSPHIDNSHELMQRIISENILKALVQKILTNAASLRPYLEMTCGNVLIKRIKASYIRNIQESLSEYEKILLLCGMDDDVFITGAKVWLALF